MCLFYRYTGGNEARVKLVWLQAAQLIIDACVQSACHSRLTGRQAVFN